MLKQTKDMELEIKHIAPYLPYGLQVLRPDNKTILSVNGIVGNLYIFDEIGKHETYGAIKSNGNKPLLYPKSHLYKLQDEMVARWGQGLTGRSLEYWKQTLTAEMMQDDYNSIRYDFVQFMLEKNIDVFGLIPAGLAEEIK